MENLKEYLMEACGKKQEDVSSANPFRTAGFDEGKARLGWVTVPGYSRIKELLCEFKKIAAGKKYFIFVGMGGSVNGVKVLIPYAPRKNIFALDSLDPQAFQDILKEVPDLKQTLVIAMSKTATTKETQCIAGSLRETIGSLDNFLWVIDLSAKEILYSLGWQGAHVLPLQVDGQEDIGGRFSSPHTLVFLLPLFILLRQDIQKTERLWERYSSLQATLIDDAFSLARKHREVKKAFFAIQVKKTVTEHFQNWIVQLFNESLGSKKETLEVKTMVVGSGKIPKEFFVVRSCYTTASPIVYIMAQMYFLQLFVAFYAAFQNLVFVNQPYVEVYKKELKLLCGTAAGSVPLMNFSQLCDVIHQHKGNCRFLEAILFFSLKPRQIKKLQGALQQKFPKLHPFVFVGSDWNHHSYQAAFRDKATLYLIVLKDKYLEKVSGLSRETVLHNTETLKQISFATFKTISEKAFYCRLSL